jgi:RNA polymerase sigma-70 factor (sigma-E family)
MDWLSGASARAQFERFVDEVTDDLVRTGYLMTYDVHETEDLVQETLVRVARHWRRVRSMDHPIAYARRVLVNLVIDGRGRRRRRKEELAAAGAELDRRADESAALMLAEIDDSSQLRRALAELPRKQRAVIVLRFWADLPEAEVARMLDCPVGTVKSTASRALARLREKVLGTRQLPASDLPTNSPNERS